MKWFKFYGQDFLTDSKIGSLNPLQKLMWVVLLSIASQDEQKTGIIKFLTEERLKELCGISDNSFNDDWSRTNETLETFCNMNLVSMPDENTIIINNYNKLQTENFSSTERVKAFRARNRAKNHVTDETNVTLHETQNETLDKNRIDKNRELIDKSIGVNAEETLLGKKYGEEEINGILEAFSQHINHIPADRKPRQMAQNIRQLIWSFIKREGVLFQELRGEPLTYSYVLTKSWDWYMQKDYAASTEKLETFKAKFKVFLDDVSRKLKEEKEVYEQARN